MVNFRTFLQLTFLTTKNIGLRPATLLSCCKQGSRHACSLAFKNHLFSLISAFQVSSLWWCSSLGTEIHKLRCVHEKPGLSDELKDFISIGWLVIFILAFCRPCTKVVSTVSTKRIICPKKYVFWRHFAFNSMFQSISLRAHAWLPWWSPPQLPLSITWLANSCLAKETDTDSKVAANI